MGDEPWKGESSHVCLTTDDGWAACPPDLCEGVTLAQECIELRQQLKGSVNLDDEVVIERATRALCDEEWWEDDWMTAMNVVGIVFQAAKEGHP